LDFKEQIMSSNKMTVRIVVLCLVVVCGLMNGCRKHAEKPSGGAAGRLGPYELDAAGFIANWLILGTFPNPGDRPNNKGFDIDYLKNYGGEAGHIPANGMEITKDDGKKVKWLPYEAKYTGRVDFTAVEHLGLGYEQEDILAYAACWLECDKDANVQLRVGSDDGYKLWVDHNLVGVQHVYRSAYQDQENYPIKLSKGMHLVLIKVDQDYGSFEFMMRVTTAAGNRAGEIKVWN
jgi:hypothetical protein